MALTNAFREAVNAGNVRRIRIMMKDSLLVDPTFKEFKEMENASASVEGLYDIHDGREFELNKKSWDDNYMDKQMVQLVGNFSHERIQHVKEVVRYLRPVNKIEPINKETKYNDYANENTYQGYKKQRHDNLENKNNYQSYKEQKRRDKQQGRYKYSKFTTGAVVGAAVGGAVTYAVVGTVGATVVTGVVAGAVVGGVAISIVSNGGK